MSLVWLFLRASNVKSRRQRRAYALKIALLKVVNEIDKDPKAFQSLVEAEDSSAEMKNEIKYLTTVLLFYIKLNYFIFNFFFFNLSSLFLFSY